MLLDADSTCMFETVTWFSESNAAHLICSVEWVGQIISDSVTDQILQCLEKMYGIDPVILATESHLEAFPFTSVHHCVLQKFRVPGE